ASAGSAKVVICHVPPGNPGNAHTITVSEAAVAAHLGHGDHLGSCESGNSCDPNPCVHGTCQPSGSSYTCTCQSGWTGTNCDQDINECVTVPGACPPFMPVCINIDGGYMCQYGF
ncbi:MAG TPA: calcium-binding EGF-like domain-containing protein, partial [Thermoanaerobaculia bacterium]|nr:calcium-binding EGF-like domain-containing protein [Thermoanaerobaculia bacterium]